VSRSAAKRPPGLRISELAKLADVSIPTIKHYLKEGLLPRPIKTGRTMSYYDESCVDRVRLIKRLQNERFLPLNVIKQILESGGNFEQELMLREGIMGISRLAMPTRAVTHEDIEKATGYDLSHLKRAEDMGVILPRSSEGETIYDTVDQEILTLIRQREDIGIPFEYSVSMMAIYRKYMKKIVEEDAALFVENLLSLKSTEEVIRYVWEGDSALVAYMPLIRAKLTRSNVERLFSFMDSIQSLFQEAFVFRCLSGIGKTPLPDTESIQSQSPLLKLVARAVTHPNQTDDATPLDANGVSTGEVRELLTGIREIIDERPDDALSRFDSIPESDPLGSMIRALEGVAYIMKATQSSGFMPIISNTKDAMSRFDLSRKTSKHLETDLLTTYIRGMGLSVIPGEFGTHNDALSDLTRVIQGEGEIDGDDQGEIDSLIIRELAMKSAYFLVTMHITAGKTDAAVDILKTMVDTGGEKYYASWAKKMLRKIEQEARERETGEGGR
jgi:DNA-binding transcriptional MerR regulator